MPTERVDRRERMAAQTRQDILTAARKLFAERGYVATSIGDIAAEADVAVQTIYSRLGSKRGMLMALIDLIDEESGVAERAAEVLAARTPAAVLGAEARLTRAFQERCGDVIGALFAASAAEPQLTEAVAEGQRRHRDGARITVDRIAELGGLRADVTRAQATGLLSAALAHDGWRELVDGQGLSWDDAEAWLVTALARALLVPEVDAADSFRD
jgi:AcrR family transcriptional regulator